MKELVVISGKGGTGKTSIVASFAALTREAVLADCDVDAPDLHLILEPEIITREPFSGGKRARVDPSRCIACGQCRDLCRFGAVRLDGPRSDGGTQRYRVDPIACEGCGVCAWFCPEHAIDLVPAVNGEWFISRTRFGSMVHARLGIAESNSGKLVSLVRRQAREVAEQQGLNLLIIDGSPGIGCPVIASITGADLVLIVTEPTLSGLHDLQRVMKLTRHLEIPAMVCVNKQDLNPQLADRIESQAGQQGVALAGRVRYDRAVTEAQMQKRSVVEYRDNGCAADIRQVWSLVQHELQSHHHSVTT